MFINVLPIWLTKVGKRFQKCVKKRGFEDWNFPSATTLLCPQDARREVILLLTFICYRILGQKPEHYIYLTLKFPSVLRMSVPFLSLPCILLPFFNSFICLQDSSVSLLKENPSMSAFAVAIMPPTTWSNSLVSQWHNCQTFLNVSWRRHFFGVLKCQNK